MTEATATKSKPTSGRKGAVGRLFVLELSANRIYAMNTDGSDRKVIVSDGHLPDGIVVDVGAVDRAIVHAGTGAHVGPVDMAGCDIDRDAIRQLTIGDDDLSIGTVRIHRLNTVVAQLQHDQSASCSFLARGGFRFCRGSFSHVILLYSRGLMSTYAP